jgi:hypothetical protein
MRGRRMIEHGAGQDTFVGPSTIKCCGVYEVLGVAVACL